MDILVKGGQVLEGEIEPSGSKNSAVHIIPSTLLIDKQVVLQNIPEITDVVRLISILEKIGSRITWNKDEKKLIIDNSSVNFFKLSRADLGNMKGTSLLWGAFLSRFGKVEFEDLPGGCTLGLRPFEPIYKVFKDLGVSITETATGVIMDAKYAHAETVWLTEMSPTATTNLVLLACSLKGVTKVIGAASEPQVQDVCNFLVSAGAKISGIGTNVIEVEGVGQHLTQTEYELLPDHYEIATFLALGACTGGEIKIHNSIPEYFKNIEYEFSKFNIFFKHSGKTAIIQKGQEIKITGSFEDKTLVVRPQPWPGLPVDLLPIFIPLALAAPTGYMMFHNWMYESGLFWVNELTKLGAEVIMSDPHRVIVISGRKLVGATLEAPYIIRATVALSMAAMLAEGESKILNADTLYRGHPNFSGNLQKLGAKINEVK